MVPSLWHCILLLLRFSKSIIVAILVGKAINVHRQYLYHHCLMRLCSWCALANHLQLEMKAHLTKTYWRIIRPSEGIMLEISQKGHIANLSVSYQQTIQKHMGYLISSTKSLQKKHLQNCDPMGSDPMWFHPSLRSKKRTPDRSDLATYTRVPRRCWPVFSTSPWFHWSSVMLNPQIWDKINGEFGTGSTNMGTCSWFVDHIINFEVKHFKPVQLQIVLVEKHIAGDSIKNGHIEGKHGKQRRGGVVKHTLRETYIYLRLEQERYLLNHLKGGGCTRGFLEGVM